MRILMISDVYFPRVNGVSTSIATFRRDLQAAGHRVLLVVPQYPRSTWRDDPDVRRVASARVPRDPEDRIMSIRSLRALRPELVRFAPNVIHIQTPFVAHYSGVSLGKSLRVPVIESYHTYFEHYLQHYVPFAPAAVLRALARRVTVSQCNAVAAVLSPSRAMADALTAYGVETPIHILPTGLNASQCRDGDGHRFRAAHGIAARPMALFVGRVAHEKNIEFLLQMLPKVVAAVPDALLVIAGEGPAATHIRRQVAHMGLDDHVQMIGNLDRDTALLDCYRAADVFVFASRTETQGLVLLEALAQGTPVVSTAVMGTADVLRDANGALVVPERIEEFSAAVIQLLTDRDMRRRLSTAAQADVVRWTSTRCAASLAKLYADFSTTGRITTEFQYLANIGTDT